MPVSLADRTDLTTAEGKINIGGFFPLNPDPVSDLNLRLTEDTIQVTWNPPANYAQLTDLRDITGYSIHSYNIEVCVADVPALATDCTQDTLAPTEQSFTIRNLLQGVEYQVRVITTYSDTTTSTASQNIITPAPQIDANSIQARDFTTDHFILSWQPLNTTIKGYHVYLYADNDFNSNPVYQSALIPPGNNEHQVDYTPAFNRGLLYGTKVVPVSLADRTDPTAAEEKINIGGFLPLTEKVTNIQINAIGLAFQVSWNHPPSYVNIANFTQVTGYGIQSYTIDACNTTQEQDCLTDTINGTQQSFLISEGLLLEGTEYQITITATFTDNTTTQASQNIITPLPQVATSSIQARDFSTDHFTIAWQPLPSDSINGYHVYLYANNDFDTEPVYQSALIPPDQSHHQVDYASALHRGVLYGTKVVPVSLSGLFEIESTEGLPNIGGFIPMSEERVSNIQIVSGYERIRVSWSPPASFRADTAFADVTGYSLQYEVRINRNNNCRHRLSTTMIEMEVDSFVGSCRIQRSLANSSPRIYVVEIAAVYESHEGFYQQHSAYRDASGIIYPTNFQRGIQFLRIANDAQQAVFGNFFWTTRFSNTYLPSFVQDYSPFSFGITGQRYYFCNRENTDECVFIFSPGNSYSYFGRSELLVENNGRREFYFDLIDSVEALKVRAVVYRPMVRMLYSGGRVGPADLGDAGHISHIYPAPYRFEKPVAQKIDSTTLNVSWKPAQPRQTYLIRVPTSNPGQRTSPYRLVDHAVSLCQFRMPDICHEVNITRSTIEELEMLPYNDGNRIVPGGTVDWDGSTINNPRLIVLLGDYGTIDLIKRHLYYELHLQTQHPAR